MKKEEVPKDLLLRADDASGQRSEAERAGGGLHEVLVVVGGVVPPQDHDLLIKAGASGVFGPGTVIPISAQQILKKLQTNLARV